MVDSAVKIKLAVALDINEAEIDTQIEALRERLMGYKLNLPVGLHTGDPSSSAIASENLAPPISTRDQAPVIDLQSLEDLLKESTTILKDAINGICDCKESSTKEKPSVPKLADSNQPENIKSSIEDKKSSFSDEDKTDDKIQVLVNKISRIASDTYRETIKGNNFLSSIFENTSPSDKPVEVKITDDDLQELFDVIARSNYANPIAKVIEGVLLQFGSRGSDAIIDRIVLPSFPDDLRADIESLLPTAAEIDKARQQFFEGTGGALQLPPQSDQDFDPDPSLLGKVFGIVKGVAKSGPGAALNTGKNILVNYIKDEFKVIARTLGNEINKDLEPVWKLQEDIQQELIKTVQELYRTATGSTGVDVEATVDSIREKAGDWLNNKSGNDGQISEVRLASDQIIDVHIVSSDVADEKPEASTSTTISSESPPEQPNDSKLASSTTKDTPPIDNSTRTIEIPLKEVSQASIGDQKAQQSTKTTPPSTTPPKQKKDKATTKEEAARPIRSRGTQAASPRNVEIDSQKLTQNFKTVLGLALDQSRTISGKKLTELDIKVEDFKTELQIGTPTGNAQAEYIPNQDIIKVSSGTAERLAAGLLKPEDLELLLHEMRHALQSGLGRYVHNPEAQKEFKDSGVKDVSAATQAVVQNAVEGKGAPIANTGEQLAFDQGQDLPDVDKKNIANRVKNSVDHFITDSKPEIKEQKQRRVKELTKVVPLGKTEDLSNAKRQVVQAIRTVEEDAYNFARRTLLGIIKKNRPKDTKTEAFDKVRALVAPSAQDNGVEGFREKEKKNLGNVTQGINYGSQEGFASVDNQSIDESFAGFGSTLKDIGSSILSEVELFRQDLQESYVTNGLKNSVKNRVTQGLKENFNPQLAEGLGNVSTDLIDSLTSSLLSFMGRGSKVGFSPDVVGAARSGGKDLSQGAGKEIFARTLTAMGFKIPKGMKLDSNYSAYKESVPKRLGRVFAGDFGLDNRQSFGVDNRYSPGNADPLAIILASFGQDFGNRLIEGLLNQTKLSKTFETVDKSAKGAFMNLANLKMFAAPKGAKEPSNPAWVAKGVARTGVGIAAMKGLGALRDLGLSAPLDKQIQGLQDIAKQFAYGAAGLGDVTNPNTTAKQFITILNTVQSAVSDFGEAMEDGTLESEGLFTTLDRVISKAALDRPTLASAAGKLVDNLASSFNLPPSLKLLLSGGTSRAISRFTQSAAERNPDLVRFKDGYDNRENANNGINQESFLKNLFRNPKATISRGVGNIGFSKEFFRRFGESFRSARSQNMGFVKAIKTAIPEAKAGYQYAINEARLRDTPEPERIPPSPPKSRKSINETQGSRVATTGVIAAALLGAGMFAVNLTKKSKETKQNASFDLGKFLIDRRNDLLDSALPAVNESMSRTKMDGLSPLGIGIALLSNPLKLISAFLNKLIAGILKLTAIGASLFGVAKLIQGVMRSRKGNAAEESLASFAGTVKDEASANSSGTTNETLKEPEGLISKVGLLIASLVAAIQQGLKNLWKFIQNLLGITPKTKDTKPSTRPELTGSESSTQSSDPVTSDPPKSSQPLLPAGQPQESDSKETSPSPREVPVAPDPVPSLNEQESKLTSDKKIQNGDIKPEDKKSKPVDRSIRSNTPPTKSTTSSKKTTSPKEVSTKTQSPSKSNQKTESGWQDLGAGVSKYVGTSSPRQVPLPSQDGSTSSSNQTAKTLSDKQLQSSQVGMDGKSSKYTEKSIKPTDLTSEDVIQESFASQPSSSSPREILVTSDKQIQSDEVGIEEKPVKYVDPLGKSTTQKVVEFPSKTTSRKEVSAKTQLPSKPSQKPKSTWQDLGGGVSKYVGASSPRQVPLPSKSDSIPNKQIQSDEIGIEGKASKYADNSKKSSPNKTNSISAQQGQLLLPIGVRNRLSGKSASTPTIQGGARSPINSPTTFSESSPREVPIQPVTPPSPTSSSWEFVVPDPDRPIGESATTETKPVEETTQEKTTQPSSAPQDETKASDVDTDKSSTTNEPIKEPKGLIGTIGVLIASLVAAIQQGLKSLWKFIQNLLGITPKTKDTKPSTRPELTGSDSSTQTSDPVTSDQPKSSQPLLPASQPQESDSKENNPSPKEVPVAPDPVPSLNEQESKLTSDKKIQNGDIKSEDKKSKPVDRSIRSNTPPTKSTTSSKKTTSPKEVSTKTQSPSKSNQKPESTWQDLGAGVSKYVGTSSPRQVPLPSQDGSTSSSNQTAKNLSDKQLQSSQVGMDGKSSKYTEKSIKPTDLTSEDVIQESFASQPSSSSPREIPVTSQQNKPISEKRIQSGEINIDDKSSKYVDASKKISATRPTPAQQGQLLLPIGVRNRLSGKSVSTPTIQGGARSPINSSSPTTFSESSPREVPIQPVTPPSPTSSSWEFVVPDRAATEKPSNNDSVKAKNNENSSSDATYNIDDIELKITDNSSDGSGQNNEDKPPITTTFWGNITAQFKKFFNFIGEQITRLVNFAKGLFGFKVEEPAPTPTPQESDQENPGSILQILFVGLIANAKKLFDFLGSQINSFMENFGLIPENNSVPPLPSSQQRSDELEEDKKTTETGTENSGNIPPLLAGFKPLLVGLLSTAKTVFEYISKQLKKLGDFINLKFFNRDPGTKPTTGDQSQAPASPQEQSESLASFSSTGKSKLNDAYKKLSDELQEMIDFNSGIDATKQAKAQKLKDAVDRKAAEVDAMPEDAEDLDIRKAINSLNVLRNRTAYEGVKVDSLSDPPLNPEDISDPDAPKVPRFGNILNGLLGGGGVIAAIIGVFKLAQTIMANMLPKILKFFGIQLSEEQESIANRANATMTNLVNVFTRQLGNMGRSLGLEDEDEQRQIGAEATGWGASVLGVLNPGMLFGMLSAPLAAAFAPLTASFFVLKQGFQNFIAPLIETMKQIEPLQIALTSIGGSKEKGQEMFSYAQNFAANSGVSMVPALQGFKQISASVKGTGIGENDLKSLYEGINKSSVALGLNQETTERVFTGFSQVASKGKLSMEELRQQISEALPGAMGIFARAMNMTQEQLVQMVSAGQILSSDVLPKVAEQLNKEFGSGAQSAALGLMSGFNQIENALLRIKMAVANQLGPMITFVTQFVAKITNIIASGLEKIGPTIGSVTVGIIATITAGFSYLNTATGLSTILSSSLAPMFGLAFAKLTPFIAALLIDSIGQAYSAMTGLDTLSFIEVFREPLMNIAFIIIDIVAAIKDMGGAAKSVGDSAFTPIAQGLAALVDKSELIGIITGISTAIMALYAPLRGGILLFTGLVAVLSAVVTAAKSAIKMLQGTQTKEFGQQIETTNVLWEAFLRIIRELINIATAFILVSQTMALWQLVFAGNAKTATAALWEQAKSFYTAANAAKMFKTAIGSITAGLQGVAFKATLALSALISILASSKFSNMELIPIGQMGDRLDELENHLNKLTRDRSMRIQMMFQDKEQKTRQKEKEDMSFEDVKDFKSKGMRLEFFGIIEGIFGGPQYTDDLIKFTNKKINESAKSNLENAAKSEIDTLLIQKVITKEERGQLASLINADDMKPFLKALENIVEEKDRKGAMDPVQRSQAKMSTGFLRQQTNNYTELSENGALITMAQHHAAGVFTDLINQNQKFNKIVNEAGLRTILLDSQPLMPGTKSEDYVELKDFITGDVTGRVLKKSQVGGEIANISADYEKIKKLMSERADLMQQRNEAEVQGKRQKTLDLDLQIGAKDTELKVAQTEMKDKLPALNKIYSMFNSYKQDLEKQKEDIQQSQDLSADDKQVRINKINEIIASIAPVMKNLEKSGISAFMGFSEMASKIKQNMERVAKVLEKNLVTIGKQSLESQIGIVLKASGRQSTFKDFEGKNIPTYGVQKGDDRAVAMDLANTKAERKRLTETVSNNESALLEARKTLERLQGTPFGGAGGASPDDLKEAADKIKEIEQQTLDARLALARNFLEERQKIYENINDINNREIQSLERSRDRANSLLDQPLAARYEMVANTPLNKIGETTLPGLGEYALNMEKGKNDVNKLTQELDKREINRQKLEDEVAKRIEGQTGKKAQILWKDGQVFGKDLLQSEIDLLNQAEEEVRKTRQELTNSQKQMMTFKLDAVVRQFDNVSAAINAFADLGNTKFDQINTQAKRFQDTLNQLKELATAFGDRLKSQFQVKLDVNSYKKVTAEKLIEAQKTLENPDATPEERMQAQKAFKGIQASGDAPIAERGMFAPGFLETIRNKAIGAEINTRIDALLKEQSISQTLFELDRKREESVARMAAMEAKLAKAKAMQAVAQSKVDYAKAAQEAAVTGDYSKLGVAELQVQTAELSSQIADEQIAVTSENVNIQKDITAFGREKLFNEQISGRVQEKQRIISETPEFGRLARRLNYYPRQANIPGYGSPSQAIQWAEGQQNKDGTPQEKFDKISSMRDQVYQAFDKYLDQMLGKTPDEINQDVLSGADFFNQFIKRLLLENALSRAYNQNATPTQAKPVDQGFIEIEDGSGKIIRHDVSDYQKQVTPIAAPVEPQTTDSYIEIDDGTGKIQTHKISTEIAPPTNPLIQGLAGGTLGVDQIISTYINQQNARMPEYAKTKASTAPNQTPNNSVAAAAKTTNVAIVINNTFDRSGGEQALLDKVQRAQANMLRDFYRDYDNFS